MQLESQHQAALFQWVTYNIVRLPELELLFHIPNGGRRDRLEAARLKKEGVKAGVSDLFLPVARKGYHGLWIEMKAGDNKPTAAQIKWLSSMKKQGYATAVCYTWTAAAELIEKYLKQE